MKPQISSFILSEDSIDERNIIQSSINETANSVAFVRYFHQQQKDYSGLIYFFQSIFHMHINRIFISNQRLFEMIIYDYTLRLYKAKLFMNSTFSS